MLEMNIRLCLILSSIAHLLLLFYGELHDRYFEVRYTDVDYIVFTEAANFSAHGLSPFLRPTYRYTPLLAWVLVPCALLHQTLGKFLFCAFDVLAGALIYRLVKKRGSSEIQALYCASVWLFNPMSLVVSSRGNAESIMAVLVLSALLYVLEGRAKLAGAIYGFSVHFKIYPVIYALPFYFALGPQWISPSKKKEHRPTVYKNMMNIFWPSPQRLQLVSYSVLGFAAPTLISYLVCGSTYLEEAFFYHLTRRDVQHNFSPYFYILRSLTEHPWESVISLVCFLPQLMAVLYFTAKFKRRQDLPFCIFMQTYAFVTFNKVCTSQYFLWYLCLIPAIVPQLKFRAWYLFRVVSLWICSQAVWLFAAWTYEFRGADTLFYVWVASLFFLASNIFVLDFFHRFYVQKKMT